VAGLKAKGVDFETAQKSTTPVLLVPAETELGPGYRVGFKNFEVITRYNRSVRYAMAVHDLATSIADRVATADAARAEKATHLASRKSADEDKEAAER
jgi:membrane-bound lytic murein transglycosylase B